MTKLQHKNLSLSKWGKLSFLEQVANIGSEVERTLNWREKGNEKYAKLAFVRSLELFDLTFNSRLTNSQYKELARAKEAWIDFGFFDNTYCTTSKQWKKYFTDLLIALRLKNK